MTVKEYREKHPNCSYCNHQAHSSDFRCPATKLIMSKRTAKKCPCYLPAPCLTDVGDMEKKVKL